MPRLFNERSSWNRVKAYMNGLLGDTARENIELMALGLGENARSMQYLISHSSWKVGPVIAIHQKLVAGFLGEPDEVVLIDESVVVKQDDDSIGMIANSQVVCIWDRAVVRVAA